MDVLHHLRSQETSKLEVLSQKILWNLNMLLPTYYANSLVSNLDFQGCFGWISCNTHVSVFCTTYFLIRNWNKKKIVENCHKKIHLCENWYKTWYTNAYIYICMQYMYVCSLGTSMHQPMVWEHFAPVRKPRNIEIEMLTQEIVKWCQLQMM